MSGRIVIGPDAGSNGSRAACTSTWCWRRTTAGADRACRSAPVRLGRPGADRGARMRTGCWPGSGRSRWRRTSRRPPVGGAGRAADADQGGAAGSARGRRARQHLCLRGAVPRRHQPAAAGGERPRRARGAAGAGDPGDPHRGDRGRRLVPCATTPSPTASWAISSTPGRSMAATDSPARAAPARPPAPASRASCNPAAARSIARARSAR